MGVDVEKYRVTVTSIGPQVRRTASGNIVILRRRDSLLNSPKYGLAHQGRVVRQIEAGDILLFGDLGIISLELTKANENMALLGTVVQIR